LGFISPPDQEQRPWGFTPTHFTCTTGSCQHPPDQFGIHTGTSIHHSLAASCDRKHQETPRNPNEQKPRRSSPAGSQGDARGGSQPQPRLPSQLSIPAAAQQPFVSQPISGGAWRFIAINVQKINGK